MIIDLYTEHWCRLNREFPSSCTADEPTEGMPLAQTRRWRRVGITPGPEDRRIEQSVRLKDCREDPVSSVIIAYPTVF